MNLQSSPLTSMQSSSTVLAELADDDECLLCAETFSDPRTLPCAHSFCLACIDEWFCASRLRNTADGECIDVASACCCPLCCRQFTVPPDGTVRHLPIRDISIPSGLEAKNVAQCTNKKRKYSSGDCSFDEPSKQQPGRYKRHDAVGFGHRPAGCRPATDDSYPSFEGTGGQTFNEICRRQMTVDVGTLTDTIEQLRRLLKSVIRGRNQFAESVDKATHEVYERRAEHPLNATTEAEKPLHMTTTKLVDELTSIRAKRMNEIGRVMVDIDVRIATVDRLKRRTEELLLLLIDGDDDDVSRLSVGDAIEVHEPVQGLSNINDVRELVTQLGCVVVGFEPPTDDGLGLDDDNAIGRIVEQRFSAETCVGYNS